MSGYTIRPFCPDDAPGVTRLVALVYGDSYYPRDLYDSELIVRLNEAGRLVSVVALDSTAQVVGHYALERPHPDAAIAEASDAIVQPEHRHHHVLETMRVLLREEAIRIGLTGLVGYPVTNHVFTQKAEEHFGAHPCGIALGLWPRSFHNMPGALPQRLSFVIYFKYLHPPQHIRHVATHHQEMIARIYQQYGIAVDLHAGARAEGSGEVTVEYESAVQVGTIRVRHMGADTVARVHRAHEELCSGSGAKAVTVELPLAEAGTDVCRFLEQEGFFFSGVGPAFGDAGDSLLMQVVDEKIDLSLLQIDSPFARELLAYVGRERERVQQDQP